MLGEYRLEITVAQIFYLILKRISNLSPRFSIFNCPVEFYRLAYLDRLYTIFAVLLLKRSSCGPGFDSSIEGKQIRQIEKKKVIFLGI